MPSGVEIDDTVLSGSGEKPWWAELPWEVGTAVVIPGQATPEEALVYAKLDWTVSKRPVNFQTLEGAQAAVPRYFAIVRDSDEKPFGIVQHRYQIVQNRDAFAWANYLLTNTMQDAGEVKIESAGSLGGGRTVFLVAHTPFTVDLPDGDKAHTYLLIKNVHDGSGAVTCAVVTLKAICANTLARSIAGALGSFKIKHTVSADARLNQAQTALGLARGAAERYEEVAVKLFKQRMTEAMFERFTEKLLPVSEESSEREKASRLRTREKISDVYHNHPTQTPIINTAWGAFNAVSFYNDHLIEGRQMADSDTSPRENRMEAILAGNNLTDQASELLLRDIGGGRWLK